MPEVDSLLLGDLDVRLRFAPSPTGYLHVGGARTALFNYLFARAHKGKFILRIEDTDQTRSTQEAYHQLIESLKWLGIDWDEGPEIGGEYGPYFQSQRLEIYQKYFDQLLHEKKVYRCFCSDEELNNKRKRMEAMGHAFVYDKKCLSFTDKEVDELLEKKTTHTLRFKVNKKEIFFKDHVKKIVNFNTELIGDFVIKKSDGFPTYNFAVVVDDASMKISHVLRGDDHISNTPRQILIYEALNYPIPEFAHISMILGKEGEKLSKRHGSISVLDFKDKGFYPDPFINYLALLGWTPKDGEEIISREKLKQSFQELNFSTSPAIFDGNKLNYLNGQYLRNLDDKTLLNDFKETLKQAEINEFPNNINEILLVLKDYCQKLQDIIPSYKNFMLEELNYAPHLLEWIEGEHKKILKLALEVFSKHKEEYIDSEEFKELIKKSKQELLVKGRNFFMPLRVKLTGEEHGIELDVFMRLKKRDFILKRLYN